MVIVCRSERLNFMERNTLPENPVERLAILNEEGNGIHGHLNGLSEF